MRNRKLVRVVCIIVAVILVLMILLPMIPTFVQASDLTSSNMDAQIQALMDTYLKDNTDETLKTQIQAIIDGAKNRVDTAPTPISKEQQIENIKRDIEGIVKERDNIKLRMDAVEETIRVLRVETEELDMEVRYYEERIDNTRQSIDALDALIAQQEIELEQAKADVDEQYEGFKERLVTMYEEGVVTYLDVLLGATSFSDLMRRYEIITEIAAYDRALLQKLEDSAARIERVAADLEADKQRREDTISTLGVQITVAQDKIATRDQRIADLTDIEGQLQSLFDNMLADEQSAYDDIKNLASQIEEEKRIAAELERQRREEEAAKARREAEAEAAREAAARSSNTAAGSGGSSGGGVGTSVANANAPSAARVTLTEYTSDKFTWPVPGYYEIESSYGMRYHSILKRNSLHTGVDITAGFGSNIVAAADGYVFKAAYNSSLGNYVVIQHDDCATTYAHGSKILVSEGDTVTAGQPILQVGSTGYAEGPHCHFEVLVNGDPIDPLIYFK